MITAIHPKLPMRNKQLTQDFYCNKLGCKIFGDPDYEDYLMVEKDNIQIHFFAFKDLNPYDNYGQVYLRTMEIESLYANFKSSGIDVSPLEKKPWGQIEFSLLDPDKNLLTFGQTS